MQCELQYDNRIQPDPGGRGTICLLWPGQEAKYSTALLIWPTAQEMANRFLVFGGKGPGLSHDL